ncbi:MAG TPA: YfhO family protein, partial [Chloroflexota bacterium]
PGPGGAASPGSAEVEREDGERVRVRVRAARPAFLVLADTFYPGWTARVDGVERPIRRADYLFRAVAVPAGEHVVDFSFEPLSFRVGALVSALTMLALAAAAAATLVAPKRRPARQPGRALGIDPALGQTAS